MINNNCNILFSVLNLSTTVITTKSTVTIYLNVSDTIEFVNDGVVIHKLCIACNRAIGRFTGAASGIAE